MSREDVPTYEYQLSPFSFTKFILVEPVVMDTNFLTGGNKMAKKMVRGTINAVNGFLLPLKLLVPQNIIAKTPFLTTNEDIRINISLQHISGKLLDIGCGSNRLLRKYLEAGGKGEGVDVFDWGQNDVILVEELSTLPFEDNSYDTVSIIACLNYFVNRDRVLKEAHRVLKEDGKLVLTMVSPQIMRVWNIYKFWDRGVNHIGKMEGEALGFSRKEMRTLLEEARFVISYIKSFSWSLNSLYVAEKLREN